MFLSVKNPKKFKSVVYVHNMDEYDLKSVRFWLKDNLGKYNDKWMWWGDAYAYDGTGYKTIYFLEPEDAMAFKLTFA